MTVAHHDLKNRKSPTESLKQNVILDFTVLNVLMRNRLLEFRNDVDVMADTGRQNGTIKFKLFPMQKLIFGDSGSVPFF